MGFKVGTDLQQASVWRAREPRGSASVLKVEQGLASELSVKQGLPSGFRIDVVKFKVEMDLQQARVRKAREPRGSASPRGTHTPPEIAPSPLLKGGGR